MQARIRLFVEGDADKKFLSDYIRLRYGVPVGREYDLIATGGWEKIKLKKLYINQFRENSDAGGTNLVIFDADDEPEKRRAEILRIKAENKLNFELFLFPDNKNAGELENLLRQIINTQHQMIFDCFEAYQNCLKKNPRYTVPDIKTKIFAYLGALLPKKENDLAKEKKRDYSNVDHWDLENPALLPIRQFLDQYFTGIQNSS